MLKQAKIEVELVELSSTYILIVQCNTVNICPFN